MDVLTPEPVRATRGVALVDASPTGTIAERTSRTDSLGVLGIVAPDRREPFGAALSHFFGRVAFHIHSHFGPGAIGVGSRPRAQRPRQPGDLSRRTFVFHRVLPALGFTGGVTLLAACSNSTPPSTVGTPVALTPKELFDRLAKTTPTITDPLDKVEGRGSFPEAPTEGCTYRAGAFHASVTGKAVNECHANGITPASATVSAERVDLEVNGDGGGGLVFGLTDLQHPYLRFVVKPNGYWDLFDPITRLLRLSGNVTASSTYQLTAITYRGEVYLFVGSDLVGQVPLQPGASAGSGRVGVFAVDDPQSKTTDVAFKNFSFWSVTV